ncbi:MAG: DNA ligase D [Candidatus Berkiella sp.]
MGSLHQYQQKRNFKQTHEPKGKKQDKSNHHFVVQMHAARHLHYDFRLEQNGVLKSWAVPKGPSLDPSVKRLAVQVEDHPVEYKDFEGVIPQGEYGGGTVMIWDQGTWGKIDDGKDLETGAITFSLKGEKLKGKWKLIQIKTDPKNWLLIKAKDDEACPQDKYDIVEEEPFSVVSGRTLTEIKDEENALWHEKNSKPRKYNLPKSIKNAVPKRQLPKKFPPQLATLVENPPKGDDWLHEMKFDGYRLISVINDEVKLITRGQQDWTDKFTQLAVAIEKLRLNDTVLDGELVALDEKGLPNFQLLQKAIKDNSTNKLVYYVFDVIYYQGYDLSSLQLQQRKAILEKILPHNHPLIRYSSHIKGHGERVFKRAAKLGFEGIVSKNSHSHYSHQRNKDWLKTKINQRQEFVVGGFTAPEGERAYLGALLIGYYGDNNKLHYCGRVGTGFTDDSLHALYTALKNMTIKKSPFAKPVDKSDNVTWVKPNLIIEVEFKEWTEDYLLRHPSFKGVRNDKTPKQVSIEEVHSSVKLTHPEKILYPKDNISKQQLADFYHVIHEWILPHIINRPISLLRCPNGIDDACFYQKHLSSKDLIDNLKTIIVQEKHKKEPYIYLENMDGLIQLVQMGTLEIHPWSSSIVNIERPNYVTFDLDPADDIAWKEVVKAAFQIKDELENLDLRSFVKTTGGKGLHIVAPIAPRYSWEEVSHFARTFAQFVTLKYPDKYIDTMSKVKRKGKIFVDYLRNQRGATAIAAYSTRARTGAPVSTPLSWQELSPKMHSDQFTLHNLPKRLHSLSQDPWEDYFRLKQKIPTV